MCQGKRRDRDPYPVGSVSFKSAKIIGNSYKIVQKSQLYHIH